MHVCIYVYNVSRAYTYRCIGKQIKEKQVARSHIIVVAYRTYTIPRLCMYGCIYILLVPGVGEKRMITQSLIMIIIIIFICFYLIVVSL